jgi:hypothetical protein
MNALNIIIIEQIALSKLGPSKTNAAQPLQIGRS